MNHNNDAIKSLSSKTEWIRMFIHELKNHLATISLNVEMVEEDISDNAEFPVAQNRKRINRIKKGIHFIKEALQDLRTLSNPLEIKKSSINLNSLIHELGDFIEPECFSSGIKLEYDLEEDIPEIETDRKQLSSALINLIINAKEAIRENGVITFNSKKTGQRVGVSVKDTGGGIDPEMEEKIFRDFFSTKEDGTGLGLTIVKKIINELEGTIEFENRKGDGMTFTVSLPLSIGQEKKNGN